VISAIKDVTYRREKQIENNARLTQSGMVCKKLPSINHGGGFRCDGARKGTLCVLVDQRVKLAKILK